MSLQSCQLIDLPKISDPRGNLTFIEGGHHVPFPIERVYYLYDLPGGAERGEVLTSFSTMDGRNAATT